MYLKTTGKARLGMWPSKKSIRRTVEKVHDLTDLKTGWQETMVKVDKDSMPTAVRPEADDYGLTPFRADPLAWLALELN